jgi:hypothetical protein
MIVSVRARHTGADVADTGYSRYVEQCAGVHAEEPRRMLMEREKGTTSKEASLILISDLC